MGSATSKQLDLTFGVELEFIVKYDPEYITEERRTAAIVYDEESMDEMVFDYECRASSVFNESEQQGTEREEQRPTDRLIISTQIFLALKAVNIPVASPCALNVTELEDLPESKSDNHFWVITSDHNLKAVEEHKQSPESRFRGIELRSRILFGAPENLYASLREVRQVLNVLHNMPFEIITNHTTGLHVHVGNQRKGFPLRTLKNFGQMTYGFINAIQSIHPDHRISTAGSNGFSQPMTRHLNPAKGLAANLERIEEAPTAMALFGRISYRDRKSDAYSFCNLD